MTRILLLLSFLVIVSGCTNFYSKYYQDFTGGKNILNDPQCVISADPPKLIQGSEIEKDDKTMLEDGYFPLGVSSFYASDINQNDALKQAKKIHACTVIVYCKYKNTVSGIAPMTVPNTQTSYNSGTVYSPGGGLANYSGTSTTYGTRTTYMPYSIERYDYHASYWAKGTPPKLGIIWKDMTDELRNKVESNKGVYILAVVKGTPAFDSDLLAGDVIRRVNGMEVIDTNQLYSWLKKTQPSEIDFEIIRNGENIKKKVQLRF